MKFTFYAQGSMINPTIFPPSDIPDIGTLVNLFIPLMMLGAVILLLGMLILAAYKIITAGGTAENIEKAKKTLQYAILGITIIVLSYFIVRLIEFLVGIKSVL